MLSFQNTLEFRFVLTKRPLEIPFVLCPATGAAL